MNSEQALIVLYYNYLFACLFSLPDYELLDTVLFIIYLTYHSFLS